MRLATSVLVIAAVSAACAQTTQPGQTGTQAIDACGTLSQSAGCIVFEVNGGKYVVVATGNFHVGDNVRVVGTLDPACITICPDADGCIRGATLYDPAVLPCGTALPNFPADIITGVCSTVSASLLALTIVGALATHRRSRPPACERPKQ